MILTLEIPDWAIKERRVLRLMAGIEQIGYKLPWEDFWMIKISRCSSCGECCKTINCDKLEEEPGDNDMYRCSEGVMRPYFCCVSEPKNINKCTSKYKVVK